MKPPKNPFTRTLSIEASKDGEGHDASGTVHFPDGTYTQYLAETMAECLKLIRQDLAALQLPMPGDDDILIEEERGGYQHAYWELNFTDDAPVAAFVEQFCKDRRPVLTLNEMVAQNWPSLLFVIALWVVAGLAVAAILYFDLFR